MNQYYPTHVRQSYGVRNQCPVAVGRALGLLQVPGYKSQEVVLKYHYTDDKDPETLNAIDCLVKDWTGAWSTTQVNPPAGFNSNNTDDADALIRDYM